MNSAGTGGDLGEAGVFAFVEASYGKMFCDVSGG